jgi:hypothetical protein
MITCTIRRCTAAATIRVIRDRPRTAASETDHAWTGHAEHTYCAEHAVDRFTGTDVEKYSDTITLKPVAA